MEAPKGYASSAGNDISVTADPESLESAKSPTTPVGSETSPVPIPDAPVIPVQKSVLANKQEPLKVEHARRVGGTQGVIRQTSGLQNADHQKLSKSENQDPKAEPG
jgi:hypothetical protein